MDTRDLDLLAFGILLGSRSLATEWTEGWEWEGAAHLKAPYQEMKAGVRGEGMEEFLEHYVGRRSAETVTAQVLEAARRAQAKAAVKRISNDIQNYIKMGCGSRELTEHATDLAEACLRLARLEDSDYQNTSSDNFDDEEVRGPGHGGVVEK